MLTERRGRETRLRSFVGGGRERRGGMGGERKTGKEERARKEEKVERGVPLEEWGKYSHAFVL